jgi:hypothetical protein
MANSRYPSEEGSTAVLETALFPGLERRKYEPGLCRYSVLFCEVRYIFAFFILLAVTSFPFPGACRTPGFMEREVNKMPA